MYNISLKETVFLVFDVLAVDGQPCLRQNFKERMGIIRCVCVCMCESMHEWRACFVVLGVTRCFIPLFQYHLSY